MRGAPEGNRLDVDTRSACHLCHCVPRTLQVGSTITIAVGVVPAPLSVLRFVVLRGQRGVQS